MKELLYEWIRDIAFYTLLMTVVLHVLPEKSQRKYLQFFMGVVLIILVISPVLGFAGLERQLDEAYTMQTFDEELQRFREQQEAIEAEYQRHLEERITEAQEEQQKQAEEREGQHTEEWEIEEIQAGSSRKGEDIEIPEIQIDIGSPGKD